MSYIKDNNAAFVARNVGKTFNAHGSAEVIIKDVNFSINKGEFISILGVSGIGKSTLFKVLSGLLAPTVGEVTYGGIPVRSALLDRKFGCAFQRPILAGWRTVLENALLPLEILKPKEKSNLDRAHHLLNEVGLENDLKKYPRELSGGMQQRLSLTMALSYDPDVLFLDEAFGALDAVTRRKLQSLLLKVWGEYQRDKTVIFITHDVNEGCFMADRVFVLNQKPISDIMELKIPFSRPRNFSLLYSPEFKEIAEEAYQNIGRNGYKL